MKYSIIWACAFLLPLTAAAAEFVPLVGIPGITGSPDQNLSEYVNALYRLMISIGALMAVVKIVGAGAKYMLSDVVTDKGSAKRDIKGAIFGLLIVIGAVVILNTINADIVNTSLTFRDTTLEPTPGPPPPDVNIGDSLACANKKTQAEQTSFEVVCESKQGIVAIVPAPTAADASCVDFICLDRANVGDILTCPFDAGGIEEETFRSTCNGFINPVLNGGAGCNNLHCDAAPAVAPSNFTCTGTNCTCTYDPTETASACVTQCTSREGYLTNNIETANNRVTCTFTPLPPPAACTQLVGCCMPLAGCPTAERTDICKVEDTGDPTIGRCFYTLP